MRRSIRFCCDTGAPKSVVGRKELNRILNALGLHERRIFPSRKKFRFAYAVYNSLGRISIFLRTCPGVSKIFVELDIVDADIPALLGMDDLDNESLTPCTFSNRLIKRSVRMAQDWKERFVDEWSVPVVRSSSNHLYVEMNLSTETYFTRTQLYRLHWQFFNPSSEKLVNLLKRAGISNPGDAGDFEGPFSPLWHFSTDTASSSSLLSYLRG